MGLLNKIGDPQRDLRRINENFDIISQNILDNSGEFSNVGTIAGGFTLSANDSQEIEINIVDYKDLYVANELPVIATLEIFIDTDNDYTYLYPLGSNLTNAIKHGIRVTHYQSRIVLNQDTNEKATYLINIHNDDSSSHDIYIYFRNYYVPTPEKGIAAR